MSKADLNFTHFKIFIFLQQKKKKGVAKDFTSMRTEKSSELGDVKLLSSVLYIM